MEAFVRELAALAGAEGDLAGMLQRAADLAVVRLGAACAIDVDGHGRVAVAAFDPSERALLAGGGEPRPGVTLSLVARGRSLGAVRLFPRPARDLYEDAAVAFAATLALAVDARRAEAEAQAAQERLAAVVAESENASRAKDEFLMIVSHELRTPLNAILGWASILQRQGEEKDVAALRRGLAVIERNARAQSRLIEDVLDVSRIITGKLKLDLRRVDLAAVVAAAVDVVRPAANAKGVTIEMRAEPGRLALRGDADRLQQVVWNLTNNAVKFTPASGHVRVEVEQRGACIVLSVTDDGQGIAPEILPHVFERFRQADSSTTREHGGLGLGLAIVRHIVEAHGGAIAATSEGAGRGARFEVELPIPALEPEAASQRASTDEGEASPPPPRLSRPDVLGGLRVLLVDDEADARDLVREVLAAAGADVVPVASPLEALEALDRSRFDVLLSDIGMAQVDGYSLVRKLRTRPADRGGNVPALALTAYAAREDVRRALDAGFQTHLAKPIDPDALVLAVAKVAARARP